MLAQNTRRSGCRLGVDTHTYHSRRHGIDAITPGFARRGRVGASQEKTRLIDDFRASGVNETVSTVETDVPDTIDAALALASLYERLQPGLELNSFAVAFKNAYKNIPIPLDQQGMATIILAPPEGPPMKATLRAQPFGARRAPANWARITAFLRWALERFFNINLLVYVDDCFAVEPVSTIGSAFRVVRGFFALLGLDLEDLKEKRPTNNIELLGANVCFAQGSILASLPEKKAKTYADELRALLSNGTLSPAEAAKMRGKLGLSGYTTFSSRERMLYIPMLAQTLMFGRVGHAMLQPFSARQYHVSAGARTPFSTDLREVIPWWITQSGSLQPRKVATRPDRPVVVYTDACGAGRLGAIFADAGHVSTRHCHAPPWFMRALTGIFELELLACILGLAIACSKAPGRTVLLCCDNKGALGAVVRGSRSAPIGRMISSTLWNTAAVFNSAVWIEFVTSGLNCADPPPRSCFVLPKTERPNEEFQGIPSLFATIMGSMNSLEVAQFHVTPGAQQTSTGRPCPEKEKPRGIGLRGEGCFITFLFLLTLTFRLSEITAPPPYYRKSGGYQS